MAAVKKAEHSEAEHSKAEHSKVEELVATLEDADVAALADRLETDEYDSPFDSLKDWHLLRAIAFHRPEMVEPYLHLLDLEAFDES